MLQIKKFVFNPFGENTYIIWSETKETAIIDPGMMDDYENSILSQFIATNGLNPTHLLNTHAHIDHMAGNHFIEKTYGLVSEYNSDDNYLAGRLREQAEMFGLRCHVHAIGKCLHLNDNCTIVIGNDKLSVIYVPGHTKGHIAFYAQESNCIFTGDALFRMSIGRTDLPGGNYETLINSITGRLMILPDSTTVYPGHGEITGIGFERENNPYLK